MEKHSSEPNRCQEVIEGIYYSISPRSEELRHYILPGLEFEIFKPYFENIVFKFISGLIMLHMLGVSIGAF